MGKGITFKMQTDSDARDQLGKNQRPNRTAHRKPGLAKRLMELGARYAALPDADLREADQILGYDEHGLPR